MFGTPAAPASTDGNAITVTLRDLDKEVIKHHAKRLGPVAALVYFAIRTYCNRQGEAYPSQELIAGDLGLSRRTVQLAVQKLRRAGIVEVVNRNHAREGPRSNLYKLTGFQPPHPAGERGGAGASPCACQAHGDAPGQAHVGAPLLCDEKLNHMEEVSQAPTTTPANASPEGPPSPRDVMQAWNQVPGVRQQPSMGRVLLDRLADRSRDPYWLENWRAAIGLIPTQRWLRQQIAAGDAPNLSWFLLPNTVERLINGDYHAAYAGKGKAAPPPTKSPEVRAAEHRRTHEQARAGMVPPADRATSENAAWQKAREDMRRAARKG